MIEDAQIAKLRAFINHYFLVSIFKYCTSLHNNNVIEI